jgi:predicted transglutaminase-like cysteine proteinase
MPDVIQPIYLAGNGKGIRVFLAGNGSAPTYVSSVTIVQSDNSTQLKCLGESSFYVPPLGRWSDVLWFEDSGLTGGGYANAEITATGPIPTVEFNGESAGPISRIETYTSLTPILKPGVWSTSNPLSIGRRALAGAGTQSAGLCMGGTNADGDSAVTEEYNGTSWSTSNPLSTARSYLAGAGTQSAGLCMGGYADWYSNITEEYNGTSWSTSNPLSTARSYLAGAGTQSAGLCMGGGIGIYSYSTITEEYDGTSWSISGDLNIGRRILAGAGTQSAGLCMGGNTGSNSAVTEEYNGTSWSISNSLSTARAGLAGAGTQTAGLCMGGYTGSDSAITEEYDGTSWSRSGDLNTARRELAGCGTQSAGLCMGGYTNSAVTEEYTQPEGYDTTEEGNDVVEITQNGIITVACQPSVGETLSVIFDDGSRCIFSFINTPSQFLNGILLGSNTTQTAANIAGRIQFGALISATSSGIIITYKIYSSSPVTIETTSSCIFIDTPHEEILYYSNDAVATLPALTVYGEATQRGILGSIYGLLTFPRMFSGGSATRSKNTGDTYLPLMTSAGQVFSSTGDLSSTNAEMKALLFCGSDWMETFASMIIAPGTWDEIALQAVKWVAAHITYTSDTGPDNWKDPVHTLYDGYGDCEDGAILTYSLIRNMGIPYSNIRFYIGETFGAGHGWVMYRRPSDNQWVTLDWVVGSTYWDTITSVDSLTPLYTSVLAIQEESLDSDDYAYGSATKYVTCSDVVTLANGRQYSDSLESSPYLATLAGSFPSLLFNAYGGGYIIRNFPSLLFSATGILSPAAALKVSFPALQFTAIATQNALASINSTIPALQFSASGIISSIISLSATWPSLIFKATGLVGDSARITGSFPSLKFTATAYWTGSNTIDIDIPCILFNAIAHNSVILDADGRKITGGLALVMNTRNLSMTEYDNYGYNSLFEFNDKIFGTTSTGIHELTGDTDTGNPISWHFKIGKIDLEKNIKTKARVAWLSYRPSGDLMLTIDDGENQYEYDVESYKQIDNAVRIKIGKGLRNRFIQMELRNVNGESVIFDHLRLFSDPTKKKR